MKISLNWLKDYIDINHSPEETARILTDTGLEVETIEAVEQVKGGMKGLVIGEVLTCEKHPDADKLKITTVAVGSEAPLPIVCGAPNVSAGQKVVVATVGTTLYPTGHESFKIKKAKIRGQVSEGMICAEDEIGLGESHAGIMVLDTTLANGTPAADYFDLTDDTVFEIGLTPNRADATSHIGVARDIKAVLKTAVQWPDVTNFKVDNTDRTISVVVENTEACPRYSGITISNVTVKTSPEWLQKKLKAIGLSPINNIVDITNFVLHEVGQPLHAFDADKVKGDQVIVKTLTDGTKFTTLDEKERKLTAGDLMICNGTQEGMCIAGVFGGIGSGVTDSTKHIFLESAYFSPNYIRKTAQHHQLKTDASFRYERGADPDITVYALKRAALLIKSIAGGEISSEIIDVYPEKISPFQVPVTFKNIERLIGKNIPQSEIFAILQGLDINIENETKAGFTAVVPPYRVDVQREADIIEEILRIYGFNNIELPEYVNSDYLADFPKPDKDKIQQRVTEMLVGNGFYEVITNSLTKPRYAEADSSLKVEDSIPILNKLSEDLGVMRQSMLYSGLEVAAHNINRKQKNLRFFEFGKNYFIKKGKYTEHRRLAIYLTGQTEEDNWINKPHATTFQDLAAMVKKTVGMLCNVVLTNEVIHQSPFGYGLASMANGKEIVRYGKIKPEILKDLGIKQEIFYADIDWDLLLMLTTHNIVFEEVSKYPEVSRDLSLVIDKKVTFDAIKQLAKQQGHQLLKELNVFDVYEGESIGSDKKAYAINFILQDKEKTLTDKVIDKTMHKLMAAFENNLGATIRK